jgi:hypothetical protein
MMGKSRGLPVSDVQEEWHRTVAREVMIDDLRAQIARFET